MSKANEVQYLEMDEFGAVLFDLDGVVTDTAKVHLQSWKQLFDTYIKQEAPASCGKNPRPFAEKDYQLHVGGKGRYAGVSSFLESRGISIPEGSPNDAPDKHTVCGLGNRKNVIFNNRLDSDGVEVFASTIKLIGDLRATGLRIAVVSSSTNCRKILAIANIGELFDLCFDGNDIAKCNLKGKPSSDVYLNAAQRLDVNPKRAVVIDDAIVGVKAADSGGFGLIIGVNRMENAVDFKNHGAHVVVDDLSLIRII